VSYFARLREIEQALILLENGEFKTARDFQKRVEKDLDRWLQALNEAAMILESLQIQGKIR
jgi:hypothetical protein